MELKYSIGQLCGVLEMLVCIVNPIYKKKWQMLAGNIASNVLLALNMVLIDRIGSAIFLFLVATVQSVVNLVYSLRGIRESRIQRIVFFVLYVGLGFYGLVTGPGYVPGINGRNILELLPIMGAVLSMCFVSASREWYARRFLLGCNAVWSFYNAIIGSTAFLGSFVSVITCIVGIVKNRKNDRLKEKSI